MEEILSIVKLCPENLQEKCFELLVSHLLADLEASHRSSKQPTPFKTPGVPASGEQLRQVTLPELRDRFQPKMAWEFVVLSGYWLEEYSGYKDGFTVEQVKACFRDLRFNPKNPSDALYKARTHGHIMETEGGQLLLSHKGIDYAKGKLEGQT